MTTVFHAGVYGRFIEIQSNVKKKKLHRVNQGSIFLVDNFNNRDMYKFQSNYEENVNPIILKDVFSSRTDSSMFISIAPVLLGWSNKTS